MKFLNLFVDESGSANPRVTHSPCYILSGCVVNDQARSELKIRADQIKFKYWNKTEIVLHSREIGRKEGEFKIFQDDNTWEKFKKDLFTFLRTGGYQVFIVLVDKQKALKQNWEEKKVYEETADVMIRNFILALLAQNSKGRLVVESATSEKDFIFHKRAGYYLSRGFTNPKVDFSKVQDVLTETSFVTKKNFDIEEQIADLLAYGAKLKFLKRKSLKLGQYENEIVKIMESKLFTMHPNTGRKKKKFYSKIESFKILP